MLQDTIHRYILYIHGKTRGEDLPSCGVLCIYRGTYGIVQIYINIIISVSGKPVLYVLRRVKTGVKKEKKDYTAKS